MHVDNILAIIASKFSRNSEAPASEFLVNLRTMSPVYWYRFLFFSGQEAVFGYSARVFRYPWYSVLR